MRRRPLMGLAILPFAVAGPALSHPHEQLAAERDGRIESQIMAVRERLQQGVQARDVVVLRALYTPDFTHTHGSGKVDGRDARIVSLLAGEPTIEMAKVEELTIRILHPDTAIVTGRSPILNRAENRTYEFRWMQVYARIGGEWQLAASQATRLPASS